MAHWVDLRPRQPHNVSRLCCHSRQREPDFFSSNQDVVVTNSKFYTVFAVGLLTGTGNQAIQALMYEDQQGQATSTKIRAIQLSPNASPVNMVLQGNQSALLIGNITYQGKEIFPIATTYMLTLLFFWQRQPRSIFLFLAASTRWTSVPQTTSASLRYRLRTLPTPTELRTVSFSLVLLQEETCPPLRSLPLSTA